MFRFLCDIFNCRDVKHHRRGILLTEQELVNLPKQSLTGISDLYGLSFDTTEFDNDEIAELILQAYDRAN